LDDLPFLQELYTISCKSSLISCLRDRRIWEYELAPEKKQSIVHRNLFIIEAADKASGAKSVGYAEIPVLRDKITVRELAIKQGSPFRDIALFLAWELKKAYELESEKWLKPVNEVTFRLGRNHIAYDALAPDLTMGKRGYAWYIRVGDLAQFIKRIAPVLEDRLSASVMAGYGGGLKLNFYRDHYLLTFAKGRLKSVDSYSPESFFDGDAYFPDLTFLQLLFGYRSLEELDRAYADCYTTSSEKRVLLGILFPKRHSEVVGLA
jgi:hypothetical protein